MIFNTKARVRKAFAGAAALTLTVGGMAAMVAAPAQAASAELTYTCQTSLGAQTFTAVVSTDLPDTMVEGTSFTPTVSATVNVPQSVTNPLFFFGWNNAQGTSVATSLVDGVPVDVDLTFPVTEFDNSENPLVIQASGLADAPIVAGAAGTSIVVEASDFTTAVIFGKTGDPDAAENQSPSCVLDADQNAVVNRVEVVAAGGGEDDVELTIQAPATAKAGSGITATFPEAFVGETYGMRLEASLPTGAPTGASQNVAAAAALPTVPLGSHAVGAGGNMPLTIPADAPAGDYYLIASTSDQQYAAWTPISILPADAGPDEGGEEIGDGGEEAGDDDVAEDTETGASNLTRTGGSTFLLSGLGALTLMAGGVALVARRRIGSDL